ncbi:hypothetical protein YC2023_115270 [Brassica napus]
MADTLLSFGVERLLNLLVRESERFQGAEEQLNGLKSDVEMLKCFLEDADVKKHTSAMVRNTIKDIKEIVLDAEDTVETFILEKKLGNTNRTRKFSCGMFERRRLAFDMAAISKRISKAIRDMQSFGVQHVIVNERHMPLQEVQRKTRQTFSSVNEEDPLVGLEKNIDILVGYLVEEDSNQVISITGMGGIGKTTLARKVFNHKTTKSHFPRLAWVCVSQLFERKCVWQMILRQLRPECEVSKMMEDELQEKLVGVLETQKALIVIDDIWREGDWDLIKDVFLPKKGWKVLLTSRNEEVALHADKQCVNFKPECLTFEESWDLLQMIAFPIKDTDEFKIDEEMEEMGKDMIKHCGGLPLALKVAASLFEALFPLLKAHFPEDYQISVENLSYYWAAEGIKRPMYSDGASIREVADEYIEELVKRNMIISKRDVKTLRFETCQLHDMMSEVCLRKAEEEIFLGISTGNSKSPCKSRRLAVHWLDEIFIPETLVKNRRLRTLLFIKSGVPSSIGKLIHLRYLSLKDAFVTHLPSSMRNLKQLLYMNLCVNSSFSLYMPNFLKELRELTYLCLPRKIQKKVKMELANLVKLETLENFPTEHGNVRDLQDGLVWDFVHLKQLELNIYTPKLPDETHFPAHLTTISLTMCRLKEDPMPILEKLLHLKEVRLGDRSFCGSRMVCSMGGFPQLQKLSMTKLKEWEMWIVEEGSMPLLLFLDIDCCERLEEWILEEGSMPILRILDIICCDKLELPDGLQFITSLAPQSAAEGGSQQLQRILLGTSLTLMNVPINVVTYFKTVRRICKSLTGDLSKAMAYLVLDLSSIHWETHCQISIDSSSSPHILILVKFGKLRSSKGVQKCVVQVKD